MDHLAIYSWICPMKNKSDSLTIFIHFQKLVENYFQLKIKQLFSDNLDEYIKLAYHLASYGISHGHTSLHLHIRQNIMTMQKDVTISPSHSRNESHSPFSLQNASKTLAFEFTTTTCLINRLLTPHFSSFFINFPTMINSHLWLLILSLAKPLLTSYASTKI